jgi:hypothetical protein
VSKPFREFSGFFWNLFSFSLIYFYLLEGSKILFMSSEYFILIVHVSMCLWEFSWNFCDFRSIFRAFKQFLDFSGIVFALKKINSKKKSYPILLGRAVGPTCSDPHPHGRATGPREAHLAKPEAMADTAWPPPVLGVCATADPTPCSIKRGGRAPRALALAPSVAARYPASSCAAPPPSRAPPPAVLTFATERLRVKSTPPGASLCRVVPPSLLPIAGGPPEHPNPRSTEPAANAVCRGMLAAFASPCRW